MQISGAYKDIAANLQRQIDAVKNSVISDDVAHIFDPTLQNPTGNDIFSWLSEYNKYWWRSFIPSSVQHHSKLVDRTESIAMTYATTTIYWSREFEINSNGSFDLKNPQSVKYTGWLSPSEAREACAYWAGLAATEPYYMYARQSSTGDIDTSMHYVPVGATAETATSQYATFRYYEDSEGDCNLIYGYKANVSNVVWTKLVTVDSVFTPESDIHYVNSVNEAAYPKYGDKDGRNYIYLGQPFALFPQMARIATGSYIGSGLYGVDNPNKLEFLFQPKIVFLYTNIANFYDNGPILYALTYPSTIYGTSFTNTGVVEWIENGVKWYTEAKEASAQFNKANTTYSYIAIG